MLITIFPLVEPRELYCFSRSIPRKTGLSFDVIVVRPRASGAKAASTRCEQDRLPSALMAKGT